MTSRRKIIANRANALSSTGPKTRRGRARSATNAFRHGLSVPIQANPLLDRRSADFSQWNSPDRMPVPTSICWRSELPRLKSICIAFVLDVFASFRSDGRPDYRPPPKFSSRRARSCRESPPTDLATQRRPHLMRRKD